MISEPERVHGAGGERVRVGGLHAHDDGVLLQIDALRRRLLLQQRREVREHCLDARHEERRTQRVNHRLFFITRMCRYSQ